VIVVVGGLADHVTELVCARLEDLGYAYRLIDHGRYPIDYRVDWTWQPGGPEGWIETDDWRLDLADISAVYARYLGREGRIEPGDMTGEEVEAVHAETDAGLIALVDSLPCLVVNRLDGGMTNHSKPLQALLIRESGLKIAPTLVTTDPDEARAFYERLGGAVIYKSLSGARSIVRQMTTTQLERLPLLRNGPGQFQALIKGDDVRVHVVGDEVIATRIRSVAVDYRYGRRDGHEVELEPTIVPAEIEAGCLRLAASLGLHLAGIDLKETPDGDFYCFEINPSPGFIYYEQQTGQAISLALAESLHRAHGKPWGERPMA
jgi:glutathione synthase/RimK-type ligase-like ATP-grasp enzyme